jgi:hypothetical protein
MTDPDLRSIVLTLFIAALLGTLYFIGCGAYAIADAIRVQTAETTRFCNDVD